MKKRITSILLCLYIVMTLLPTTAWAEGNTWGGTGVAEILYYASALYAMGNDLVIKAGTGENKTNLYYADASGNASGKAVELAAISGAENAISGDTASGFDLSDISLYFTYNGPYNGNTNSFSDLDIVITMEGGELRYIGAGNLDAQSRSCTFKMTGGTIPGDFNNYAIAAHTIYISGGTVAKSLNGGVSIYVSGSPQIGGSDGEGIKLSSGQTFYIEDALSNASVYVVPQADFPDGTVIAEAGGGYTITESDLSQLHLTGSYVDNKELYLDGNQVKIREIPTQSHTHPVCGAAHTNVGDHTGECESVVWTEFSASSITDGVLPAGNYYLTEDVTLTSAVKITEGTVNLCLNGHTLTSSYTGTAVTVGAYGSGPATLNICDCGNSGELAWKGNTSSNSTACGVSIGYAGTVNLYGGTIRNTGWYGETVKLTSDIRQSGATTFNLYGGKVCHEPTSNDYYTDGVIYVNDDNCSINIYDGEVSTNENVFWGAIYADSGTYYDENAMTTVLIAGGVIKGGGYGMWLGAQSNQVRLTLAGSPAITCADEDGAGISLANKTHDPILTRNGFAPTNTISVSDFNDAGVFATSENAGDSLANYAKYFVSAKEGYFVECNDDGDLRLTACAITQQPSVENGYTVTANGSPAYQWYPAASGRVPVTEDNATACEGSSLSWRREWYSNSQEQDYFTIDLRQGDVLELAFKPEMVMINSVSISDGTHSVSSGTGTYDSESSITKYTLTAPADGTYTLSVSASLMDTEESYLRISFTATVTDDVPGETPLTGQTSNTLSTAGLASGTYICKVTWENKTIQYSDAVSYSTEQTPPASGEGYAINYADETITIETGYEVYTEKDGGTKIESGNISDHFGEIIYIRKTGIGTVDPSDWTEITIPARPAAPGERITVSDETIKGKSDGAVSGITSDMEYKIGNGEWQKGTGQPLTGLAGGTEVIVRIAATGGAPHGEEQTYAVQASERTLTVTFDSNGGSEVAPVTGLSYNEAITAPTDPTRQGYNFGGWYTDAGCTQAWNFSVDKVTDDLTLYAKWSAKPVYSISGTVEQETDSSKETVSGATVQLKKGRELIAATITDGNGTYTFANVSPGEYNIVVTKTENGKATTKTTLVTITNENEEGVNVLLPKSEVSSVVEVKPDTPAVVVGGLDDEAAQNHAVTNSSVVVTLTVEGKEETEVTASAVTAIKTEAKGKTLEYIDMTVEKAVTDNSGTTTTEVKETRKILEIVVPFQTSGRNNITVYRHHEDEDSTTTTETFTKLPTRPDSNYADGTYFVGDGYLVIYAQKFSTYAIGYTVPSSTGGGSGSSGSSGSSATPTYKPDVKGTEGGSVTVSPSAPKAGGKVTITPKPSEGYEVDKIAVIDRSGKPVEVTDYGDGTWSFTQPSGKVTISVTFREIDAACDGGITCPSRAFTDLSITAWYHEATDFVLTNGMMGGYGGGLFGPNDSLSRAQLCQILYNREGKPTVTGSSPFTDVADTAWCADAVTWANANGIVGGYGGGLFGPNDPITREQLAAILYRYAHLKGYDTTLDSTAIREFSDYESISSYAVDAMTWAVDTGVIGGYTDNTLGPQNGATRAQVAAMLMRFLKI